MKRISTLAELRAAIRAGVAADRTPRPASPQHRHCTGITR